jgi:hypothetical protein
MADQTPVVKIKQALNKLKVETSQMDVRIGVVSSRFSNYTRFPY